MSAVDTGVDIHKQSNCHHHGVFETGMFRGYEQYGGSMKTNARRNTYLSAAMGGTVLSKCQKALHVI